MSGVTDVHVTVAHLVLALYFSEMSVNNVRISITVNVSELDKIEDMQICLLLGCTEKSEKKNL